MIAKFAKKINEILIQKEIVQKEDAELYQYGIENGIVVAGNLLASGIFGIVTGRPGLVLVFLLFYASLRSYSGGSHCKSRIGCFLISMAILSIPVYTHEFVMNNVPATVILMIGIPVYTYEPVMKNVPNAVILLIGVLAVVIIIVLAPVESINKPLDEEERKYYARVTHCITALQVCVLIILFCLDLQDYFYAGYVSIVLIAVFMVMGKIAVKRYVQ